MATIRVIFDGKSFVPQQPVALPPNSEAFVLVGVHDPQQRARADAAMREYYLSGCDTDDEQWARATAPQSHRAWDED